MIALNLFGLFFLILSPSIVSQQYQRNAAHMFYRINLIEPPASGKATQIHELHFEDDDGTDFTSSCTLSSGNSAGELHYINDRDNTTFYRTNAGSTNYFDFVECHLPSPVVLENVKLQQRPAGFDQFVRFAIEYSDNGFDWIVAHEAADTDAGWSSDKETYDFLNGGSAELQVESANAIITFDFRDCSNSSSTFVGTEQTTAANGALVTNDLSAEVYGALCVRDPASDDPNTSLGYYFDGVSNYMNLTAFEFGGPTTLEFYLKMDQYNGQSTVLDVGGGSFPVYASDHECSPHSAWHGTGKTRAECSAACDGLPYFLINVGGDGNCKCCQPEGTSPPNFSNWSGYTVYEQQYSVEDNSFLFGNDNEHIRFRNARTTYAGSSASGGTDYTVSHFSQKAWDHIVLAISPSGVWTVWKNGNEVGSEQGGVPPLTTLNHYGVGGSIDSNQANNFFQGLIGYMKIYKGYHIDNQNVRNVHQMYYDELRPGCVQNCSTEGAGGIGYDGQPNEQHSWDFRDCTGQSVRDGAVGGQGGVISAHLNGGAVCTAAGVELDGIDDFISLDSFTWGGEASLEAYVYIDRSSPTSFGIFDFHEPTSVGGAAERSHFGTDAMGILSFSSCCNSASGKSVGSRSNSKVNTMVWTHLVITIDATGNTELFIDGIFQKRSANAAEHVPPVANRTNMHIGRSSVWNNYFEGIIAYAKMYPYALTRNEVEYTYHDHLFDPAISYNFVDACSADVSNYALIDDESYIEATKHNGLKCSSEGLVFDGVDDYLTLEPFSWGGINGITVEIVLRMDELRASNPFFSFGTDGDQNGGQISRIDMMANNLTTYVSITGNSTGNATTLRKVNFNLPNAGQWTRIVWRTMSRSGSQDKYVNWQVGSKGSHPFFYSDVASGNVLENPAYAFRTSNFLGKSHDGTSFFKGTIASFRMWTRGIGYQKNTNSQNSAWPPTTIDQMMTTAENSLNIPCPPGTFGANYPSCTVCPDGKISTDQGSTQGSTVCSDCPVGKFGDGGPLNATAHTVCTSCEAGKFTDISGASSCKNCTAGSYRVAGNSTSCTTCAVGKVSSAGSSDCTECSAGTYTSSATNTCVSCEAGKYSDTAGVSSCTACGLGTYSATVGSTSCSSCEAGKFQDVNGASSCKNCTAGKFMADVGSQTCHECDPGFHSPIAGSVSCVSCDFGKYSDTSMASSCVDCSAGKYSDSVGPTSCMACEAGTYSSSAGSSSCSVCGAGRYSDYSEQGTIECSLCPAGTYLEPGNTEALAHSSVSNCLTCTAGKFMNEPGATICENCPNQTWIIDDGEEITNHDDITDCVDLCASIEPVITFSPHVSSILPSEQFTISATAATSSCTYYDMQTPLVLANKFRYSVYTMTGNNGEERGSDVTFTTSLSDKRKITIPSFSFQPESSVTVELKVTNQLGVNETQTTTFNVGTAGLTAKIEGGDELTLPFQGSLKLDAGLSRDENYEDGAVDSLMYSWTCVDVTISSEEGDCTPLLSNPSTSSLVVSSIPALSRYKYTVQVTSTVNRQLDPSTASVTVFSQAVPTPIVAINSSALPLKVNPTAKLTIPGTISLPPSTDSASVYMSWSVLNDTTSSLVDLPASSFSSKAAATNMIPASTAFPFPLVIKAFSLIPGKTYKFQISSMFEGEEGGQSAVSSVSIVVNRAPSGGSMTVVDGNDISNGNNGTALITPFTLTASSWQDDDLPLSYSFSWQVQGSIERTNVGERGAANFIEKVFLPTGQILCNVRVFDSFLSYSEDQGFAVVEPPASIDAAMDSSSALVEEAMLTGDNSGALAVISSTAQVLQTTDCSAAPSCPSLNRKECGGYKAVEGGNNMCGDCLPGYFGPPGPEGVLACEAVLAQCENGSLDDDETDIDCGGAICPSCKEGRSCGVSEDCESGLCNGGVCKAPPKPCPTTTKGTECTGRGICTYISAITYETVTECVTSDITCSSECLCSGSFHGEACQYTEAEKLEAQKNRFKLLTSVLNVQESEGGGGGAVDSYKAAADQTNALKSIISEPEELDGTSVTLATSLLKNAVLSVKGSATDIEEGATTEDEGDTLSLDITEVVSSLMSTPSIKENATFSQELNSIMEDVAFLELNKLVEGEEPATLITENIKMSSVIVNEALIKETTFTPPGHGEGGKNSSSFGFPNGIRGGEGGGSGVVVTAWGKNPHATGGSKGGSLNIIGGVVKLAVATVSSEGEGSRRRRRMVASNSSNLTVACELPMAESLVSGVDFVESEVVKSFRIECIEGINETIAAQCPDQTYTFKCDGKENKLVEVNCTSASVKPVCGTFDNVLNSWSIDNCYETDSGKQGIVRCVCMFDSATVSPDFASMAETVAKSFISTVLFGASNIFNVDNITRNPTMFYTLGGMVGLCFVLCYWGVQMDEKEKVGERERVFVDYQLHRMSVKKRKALKKRDEEKRKVTIERLLRSENQLERAKGEVMKEQDRGGAAKRRWSLIANAAGRRNDVKVDQSLSREDGSDSLTSTLAFFGTGHDSDATVARQIKDSIPGYVKADSSVGLFGKTVFQFHSLLFILARKYNGEGLDRPSKVAFLFTNLLNLMFATAVTYELRAGSIVDLCSQWSGTSFEDCVVGGGTSPFDGDTSRCMWEFGGEVCTDRPLGEDQWKIAAFLSFFTSILTVPLNLLLKKIFFMGILPPSLQATKEANKRYVEECKRLEVKQEGEGDEKIEKEEFGEVESWESQCLNFKKLEEREKEKEKAMMTDKNGPAGMSAPWWKLVPHGVKRILLRKRRNEKEAHGEVRKVMYMLIDRRSEIVATIGDLESRKRESFRFDLMLISIGINRSYLSVEQGGSRTDEEDRLRCKLALQEFDTLFSSGLGSLCKHIHDKNAQKRVCKIVWERWIFQKFNYIVADGKLKDFNMNHTYGSFLLNSFKGQRNKASLKFWKEYVKTVGLEGFSEGNDRDLNILVDYEESLSVVYKLIKDDLTIQSELEDQLMKLPNAQKGIRLMEYYNMGNLKSIERIIYKMNMNTLKTLPLAIQELNKYLYWMVVIAWSGFCIFYLLSFALKQGDEAIKLWLHALFFGWIQKMLLNEPQVILVKHVLLPLIFIGTMEHGMSSSGRWQLKYHVFVHSFDTEVGKLPTSGAHRVALKRPELSTSEYIVKHTATPTPLRADGDSKKVQGEEEEGEDEGIEGTHERALKYLEEIKRASADKLFRMALEKSVVDVGQDGGGVVSVMKRGREAAENFEKALLSAGAHKADMAMCKFETIRHARSGRKWEKKRKMIMRMSIFFLALVFLLVVLDEIGFGDVFLAAVHCALLWFMDGETAWTVLGLIVAPVVIFAVGAVLKHFDLLEVLRGKMGTKDWLNRHIGIFRKIEEREKVEGFYVKTKGQVVMEWLWEESLLSWMWLWGVGCVKLVRERGLGGLVMESRVVRGAKRFWFVFGEWRKELGRKRDAVIYVAEKEGGKKEEEEVEEEEEKRRKEEEEEKMRKEEEERKERLKKQEEEKELEEKTRREEERRKKQERRRMKKIAKAKKMMEEEARREKEKEEEEKKRLEKEEEKRMLEQEEEKRMLEQEEATEAAAAAAAAEEEEKARLRKESMERERERIMEVERQSRITEMQLSLTKTAEDIHFAISGDYDGDSDLESLASPTSQFKFNLFSMSGPPIWDNDESLFEGGDEDTIVMEKAKEYKVPTPFKKGAFKMPGPMRVKGGDKK